MSPMRLPVGLAVLLAAPLAAAAPTGVPNQDQFPIADGFPQPNGDQIVAIQRGAHGTLPGGAPPQFHADTYKSLQLIATNEMAEVSLYEQCLIKIKNRAPGFGIENFITEEHRQFVISTFEGFYQQEEVHALIGQGGLQANGQQPIAPSQYQLNTNTYQDCLKTATIIGDNVLGTSQGVINQAIAAGDAGLAAQLDSLIAQEGQQSGFLRAETKVNGKHSRPAAAMPAYTASTREWLFSLLQQYFIKPGTDSNKIDLPVKFPLAVKTQNIESKDQVLQFTVNLKPQTGNNYTYQNVNWSPKDLFVTYISGQNTPFSSPLKSVNLSDSQLTFSADFPADKQIVHGFAIAALTTKGDLKSFQEVSDNSLAGPGTIELID